MSHHQGGGDDQDPPRPFRQDKGKTVYLEQQGGKKKRWLDRATRAAIAIVAASDQVEQVGQLRISSDKIAFRVSRLSSQTHSSAARSTPSDPVTTPPPSLPAPAALEPSATSAVTTSSTTPASTAPAPAFAPPIPPPRFQERDKTKVRPLAVDPRLLDLQRATAAMFGFYHPTPEDTAPAPVDPLAPDIRVEDKAIRQFEDQDAATDTSSDEDEDLGIPPPPPVPPRSHDHKAGGSSATPSAAPPAIDPALAAILQSLTQQQALMVTEQARQASEQAR
eukprot:XP_020407922.1 predicted GPI-anchored protein 58 [Zea mays]